MDYFWNIVGCFIRTAGFAPKNVSSKLQSIVKEVKVWLNAFGLAPKYTHNYWRKHTKRKFAFTLFSGTIKKMSMSSRVFISTVLPNLCAEC